MDTQSEPQEQVMTVPAKKKNSLEWILWWQTDQDELKKQVDGYSTLKVTQSARGISAILLLVSVAVTAAFVFLLNVDPSAFIDAGIMLVLAFFIFKGHRWAMIAAMILWTFEKGVMLYDQLQTGTGSFVVTSVIWWTVYMHAFYLAFQVEQARKKA